MEAKFSQRVRDVLSFSREEAIKLGNESIGIEHLFLGILKEGKGVAFHLMAEMGMDLIKIRNHIEKSIKNDQKIIWKDGKN